MQVKEDGENFISIDQSFLSSIIIEMSSAYLKFETYRYKRVNDRSSLNENDEDKRMVIILSFDTILCFFMQSHQQTNNSCLSVSNLIVNGARYALNNLSFTE